MSKNTEKNGNAATTINTNNSLPANDSALNTCPADGVYPTGALGIAARILCSNPVQQTTALANYIIPKGLGVRFFIPSSWSGRGIPGVHSVIDDSVFTAMFENVLADDTTPSKLKTKPKSKSSIKTLDKPLPKLDTSTNVKKQDLDLSVPGKIIEKPDELSLTQSNTTDSNSIRKTNPKSLSNPVPSLSKKNTTQLKKGKKSDTSVSKPPLVFKNSNITNKNSDNDNNNINNNNNNVNVTAKSKTQVKSKTENSKISKTLQHRVLKKTKHARSKSESSVAKNEKTQLSHIFKKTKITPNVSQRARKTKRGNSYSYLKKHNSKLKLGFVATNNNNIVIRKSRHTRKSKPRSKLSD